MSKDKIRVLIAEDTEIGISGLKAVLETAEDIKCVGATETVYSIPRLIQELSPDVILMDLKYIDDESAGWIKIREIKRERADIKIIAITAYPQLMSRAWESGADQVVSKNLKRVDLLDLIRTTSLRRASIPFDNQIPKDQKKIISPRELEVLELLDQGLSDKEISKTLNIEVNTVKNHVKSIIMKLNSDNRRKASIKAREIGLIK